MAEERMFVLDQALSKGYAPTTRLRRNEQFLSRARNVKLTELDRARLPETITDPSDGSYTVSHPFPQYFRCKDMLIQARETALYQVNESTGALTQLLTYDFLDPDTEAAYNEDFGAGSSSPTNWSLSSGSWGVEWTYDSAEDTITHVAGNTAQVQQANGDQANAIESGKLYRVRLTVDSISAGSLTVQLGTSGATASISAAGVYEEEVTAGSAGNISIIPTSACNAVISEISVMEVDLVSIPSGGGAWHFAAFDRLFVMANEAAFILRSPRWNWRPVVSTTRQISVVGQHGDRLFLGGFDGTESHWATSFWEEVWNEWVQNSPDSTVVHSSLAIGENIVFWARKGGGATDWPFTIEAAMLGLMGDTHRDNSKPYIKDQFIKGEAGFIIHPFKGGVNAILPMAERVHLYGERGVSVAVPQQNETASYDVIPYLQVGTVSRTSVGGDERKHCMVGEDGQLWILQQNQVQPEDFRNLLNPMIAGGNDLLVLYDPYEGDAYIHDGSVGYLRTQSGMSEITKLPMSLLTSADGLIGQVLNLATATPSLGTVLIETTEFDMKEASSVKAIRHIIFTLQDVTNAEVTLLYKNDHDTTWTESDGMLLNDESYVVPNLAAQVFKIRFEATPGAAFSLSEIMLRWVLVGKHTVRGQFSAP